MSAGWSPHCLTAELCLELSKVVAVDDGGYKEKLREKSLKLARRSFDKMVDKGTRSIHMHIAFADCEPILIALDKQYTPILGDTMMVSKRIGSRNRRLTKLNALSAKRDDAPVHELVGERVEPTQLARRGGIIGVF